MNMIEKMARAIMMSRGGCDVTDWREAEWNPNVAQAISDARAALQAMLEPSEGMVEVGDDTEVDGVSLLSPGESLHVWQSMIRAALEEN